MVSYLSDDSILCKADKIGPGRVVDILKDCGSFDPGSSPGRGVKKKGFTSNFLINVFSRFFIQFSRALHFSGIFRIIDQYPHFAGRGEFFGEIDYENFPIRNDLKKRRL